MRRPSKHSPEVRERAVRMVFDHAPDHASQWAAIRSVADKLGCTTETLRRWVLILAAISTLAFSGCVFSRNKSDASFVSNPPPLESYQAASSKASDYQTAATGAANSSRGFPFAASNCSAGGFS